MVASTANKSDSNDGLSKTLTGVLAGIKLNLTSSKAMILGGNSVTPSTLTSDFQGFVDFNTSVDASKAATAQQVTQRKQKKAAIKAELALFMKWAVLTYGPAAYAMFNMPPPKPRASSPTKKAIASKKISAAAAARKAAKAALAPKQETLVAFDADGNEIGGSTAAPAAPASANPASPAPSAQPAAAGSPGTGR